jgi:GntR family transcriptional regulator, negative regulator for fad regulon and positive regulator of fabA
MVMNWNSIPKPAELAESRLITAILDGHFAIGDSLPPERELAAQLGVTRPTLREVLQRLARDGWIEIHHGRPTRVRNYWQEGRLGVLSAIVQHPEHAPRDFVPNLLAVRQLLAPAYTEQAVALDPVGVCDLLAEIMLAADAPEAMAAADWQLHHRLTILSGNPIFTLILNGFEMLYHQMGQLYFAWSEARHHSRTFYQALLAAARAGDARSAGQIAQETMAVSLRLWRQAEQAADPVPVLNGEGD